MCASLTRATESSDSLAGRSGRKYSSIRKSIGRLGDEGAVELPGNINYAHPKELKKMILENIDGCLTPKQRAEFEAIRERSSIPATMLDGSSPKIVVWDMGLVVTILFTTFWVPYIECFEVSAKIGVSTPWRIVEITADIYFVCDMLLTFRKSLVIRRDRRRVLLRLPKDVTLHYLQTWFVLDLIGLCSKFISNRGIALLTLLRLSRMLRTLQLLDTVLSGATPQAIFRLLNMLFILLICSHVFTCMVWLAATVDSVEGFITVYGVKPA